MALSAEEEQELQDLRRIDQLEAELVLAPAPAKSAPTGGAALIEEAAKTGAFVMSGAGQLAGRAVGEVAEQTGLFALMEQLGRGGFAVRAGAKELIKQTTGAKKTAPGLTGAMQAQAQVLSAAKRGFQLKEQPAGEELLYDMGVLEESPKVRKALGFAIDVATDPLTYVGVGTLTRAGKVAQVVSSRIAAGMPLGALAGKAALAASKRAQAELGQRAVVTFAGLPVFRGTKFFGASEAAGELPFIQATRQLLGPVESVELATVKEMKRLADVDQMRFLDRVRSGYKKWQGEFNEMAKRQGMDRPDLNARMTSIRETKILDERLARGEIRPDEYAIARDLQRSNAMELEAEIASGVKVREWTRDEQAYFSHIATPEALKFLRRVKGGTPAIRMQKLVDQLQADLTPGFTKARTIDLPVAEANAYAVTKDLVPKGVKLFYDDPVYVETVRNIVGFKARSAADFLTHVGNRFGVDTAIGAQGYRAMAIGPLAGKYLPADIAEFINGYWTTLRDPRVANQYLRAFDAVTTWWKAWSLGIRPAYHLRNAVGNIFNNFLGGVTNPADYIASSMMQMGVKGQVKTAAGDVFTYKQISEGAERLGVVKQGMYGAEIEAEALGAVSRAKGVAGRIGTYVPFVGVKSNKLLRLGFWAGTTIEDNARIAHFIAKVRSGLSMEDAAASVRKYLFDYQDLTDMERSFWKRVMPFFTWSRKNIPLQLAELAKQPGKALVVDKIRREIESGEKLISPELIPSFARRSLPIQLGRVAGSKLKQGLMTLGAFLPVADLEKLASAKDFATAFFDLLHPGKAIAEIALDRRLSVEFGSKISRSGATVDTLGLRMDPRVHHLLRSLVAVNEIDRLNPGGIFGQPGKTSGFGQAVEKAIGRTFPFIGQGKPGGLLEATESRVSRVDADRNKRFMLALLGVKLQDIDISDETHKLMKRYRGELGAMRADLVRSRRKQRPDPQGTIEIRASMKALIKRHKEVMARVRADGIEIEPEMETLETP